MPFNQTTQDKTCKISRKFSFSIYVQQYNRKQLNQLILCPFDAMRFNCFLLQCCTQLEKEDFLQNVHVLSCFVQLKSVLLISCVLWIFFFFFFRTLAVNCFRLSTVAAKKTCQWTITKCHLSIVLFTKTYQQTTQGHHLSIVLLEKTYQQSYTKYQFPPLYSRQ